MPLLHTSPATLVGTAYFELLPGRHQDKCWNEGSVFLDEEAFGYIEPVCARALPEYDHYAFTAVQTPRWSAILTEFDRILLILDANPTDLDLARTLRFYYPDTESKFFADRGTGIANVRDMVRQLRGWLHETLREHDCVTILGL
jgi:hypothetical protein